MASSKITALTALTTVLADDILPVVDIHDTTQAASGTTKQITVANLQAGLLKGASNLSDLANAGTARTNLGLGTAAVQPATAFDSAGAAAAATGLYGYLGWTYDPAITSGGAVLGASGTITLCKIPWPVTQTVTNIVVCLNAGGTLTAGQNFAAIIDSTGARLGVTADQSGVWNSAGTTPKTMAVSGGPVSVPGAGASGFVYGALLWNGSVSPQFFKSVANAAAIINGALPAASLRTALNSSANTSVPSSLTLSASTAASNLTWMALS